MTANNRPENMRTRDDLYQIWRIMSGQKSWCSTLLRTGFTWNEIDTLMEIDDNVTKLTRKERVLHDQWLAENVPRNNLEALKIFPECKHLVQTAPNHSHKSGRISEDDISKAKSVDIVRVVSSYVQLRNSSSDRMIGHCPFHHEKTPSFTIFRGKNNYYCFGCHEGGGPITFLMKQEQLTFKQAVLALLKFQ